VDKQNIVVKYVRGWPALDIIRLYRVGGWWSLDDDPSQVRRLIRGSFVFAVAVDVGTGRAVGMGRVLSDGVSDAYIQDVVVLPEYRRNDVGGLIVASLRDYCLEKGVAWIALVAEPGTERFYGKLGFKTKGSHTPMLYHGG